MGLHVFTQIIFIHRIFHFHISRRVLFATADEHFPLPHLLHISTFVQYITAIMHPNSAISQSLFWRFSSFFTSLLLTLLVARTFGPVTSGEVNYFVAIASLVVLLSSFNLDAAIIHFTAAGKIQLNKILTLSLLIVLVSAVIYFVFSIYWSGKTASLAGMQDFWLYAGVYLLGLRVHALIIAIFYGRQNFFIPGLVISLINVLQIVLLLIVFNKPDEQSLMGYMRLFFLVPFIQAILLWLWLRAKEKFHFQLALPLKGEWKAISRFSLVIFITNIILS